LNIINISEKKFIKDLSLDELESFIKESGEKLFRAKRFMMLSISTGKEIF